VIAVVYLLVLSAEVRSPASGLAAALRPLALSWISAAAVLTSIGAVGPMGATRTRRLEASAVLQWSRLFFNPHDMKLKLCPDVPLVMRMAPKLDRFGYLTPPLLHDPSLQFIAVKPHRKPDGFLDRIDLDSNGAVVVQGWAVLRGPRRVADAVVLSYDDAAGNPRAFALTIERAARPDVVKSTGRGDLKLAGFRAQLAPGLIRPSEWRTVRAWAFDALEQRAYPLGRATG
jgi:hypothetical protein